ncbi:MAG: sensor histidine kinase [Proteobacteria bacterium]|nr:sensor histidine kinase [Pseudomonadota bacterium]
MWLKHANSQTLLRGAGLFTWAMVGLTLIYSSYLPQVAEDEYAGFKPMSIYGWACYLAYGIAYLLLTHSLGALRKRYLDYLLLIVLSASAIGVSYFNQSGLGSLLLVVAASILPWILKLWTAIASVIVAQFAVIPVFMYGLGFPALDALTLSLLYAGFSGFVFVTSLVAKQQANAREEQRRINAELRGTRALLAESARVNERTRIARDLHDLLGHHLTALSMNLEVAGHLADGPAQQHVKQAHQLARLLLTDVREAVSHLREGGAIELEPALRPLTEHVPGLVVELDMEPGLRTDDPECAHVLLRSTQEIITNAVRHSGGDRLHLSVHRSVDGICIDAEDNGHGSDAVVAGNGLNGMRERVIAHGGTMQVETAPGRGFRLQLDLPLKRLPPSTVRDTA